MPTFELEDPTLVPCSTSVEASSWVESWRAELDGFYSTMRKFESMDIAEVLLNLSAFSARVSEMRAQVSRVDSRRCTAFRTREIEPLLEEVDRQFRIHSRLQSVRQMEWDASKGQV